ncbi:hypothetical protein PINS_up007354 [Pythium insidiosum]|nr:hypothetical protein PINS_up007354 [Pythium insidiosum]
MQWMKRRVLRDVGQRQKQVAETLAQQLRRLRLKRRTTASGSGSAAAATATATAASTPAKKPKNASTTRAGNKQLVLERSETDVEYPSWTLAQSDARELGDASPFVLASTVFRVATRHLLRTGNVRPPFDWSWLFLALTSLPLTLVRAAAIHCGRRD